MKDTANLLYSSQQSRVISEPGATIEVKVIELSPRFKAAMARSLTLGTAAARPDKKTKTNK